MCMSDWPSLILGSCVELKGSSETNSGGVERPPLLEPEIRIKASCVLSDEELLSHIRHALTLEYPDVCPSPPRIGEEVIMCASGPSLAQYLDEIRAYKGKSPIVACNGAHDYLIEHGIVPDYACALDPTDIERFKLKTKECNYFLASQCRPELFEYMKGYNIAVFHVAYKADLATQSIFYPHPVIGGGSTTGLKAISLFYLSGFRTFHLYGYDGSFCETDRDNSVPCSLETLQELIRTHKRRVTGEDIPEKAFTCRPGHIDKNGVLVKSPKEYLTTTEMGMQATELSRMMDEMIPDAEIIPHGNGLIQEVLRMRKQLEYTPDIHRLRPKATSGISSPGAFDSHQKLETSINLAPHIVTVTD